MGWERRGERGDRRRAQNRIELSEPLVADKERRVREGETAGEKKRRGGGLRKNISPDRIAVGWSLVRTTLRGILHCLFLLLLATLESCRELVGYLKGEEERKRV